MKQSDIKEFALAYIKDYAEYDSPSWSIAFYSKQGGVYSGVSRYRTYTGYPSKETVRVYGFIVDFVHKFFSIEGITGKQIKKTAGNLNDVFGRDSLALAAARTESPVLNKFYALADALGNVPDNIGYWDTSREAPNTGRGIYRAITKYPVAEQLTECEWFHQYASHDVGELRDLLLILQSNLEKPVIVKGKTTKQSNLRKALGFSVKQYKTMEDFSNARMAKRYVEAGSGILNVIDRAYAITAQVDAERGYHNAEEWCRGFSTSLLERYYNTTESWRSVNEWLHAHTESDFIPNLIRYLYGSCFHQQALTYSYAIDYLKDYYLCLGNVKNPVKYPRYLATAHDVASANAKARGDSKYKSGVMSNYRDNKKLEGKFGNYAFIVAMTPEEIIDEANQQSNCVAGYISSVANHSTTIMFMRKLDNIDSSWVTFEVREDSIVQAYATYNAPLNEEQSKALRQFAKANELTVELGSVRKIDGIVKPKIKELKWFHAEVEEDEKEDKFKARIVAA